jgi:hypothetical protein
MESTNGINKWNQQMESIEGRSADTAMEQPREDDNDVDDGGDNNTVRNWYTRQKNQLGLTNRLPLQQPTQDTRSLAGDTLVNGNTEGINRGNHKTKNITTMADMDDDHNLT